MQKKFLTTRELANKVDLNVSTIKYYSDEGLLSYQKTGGIKSKSEKKYPIDNINTLNIIKKLKIEGYSIAMIQEIFAKDYLGRKSQYPKSESIIKKAIKDYFSPLEVEFLRCVVIDSLYTECNEKVLPKKINIDIILKSKIGNMEFKASFEEKNSIKYILFRLINEIIYNLQLSFHANQYSEKLIEYIQSLNEKFSKTIPEFDNNR